MKVTTMSYGQFLVNTPVNFTGTYFADTVDGLEHNSVHRFLIGSRLTPALVREKISDVIIYSPKGRVMFDDSVLAFGVGSGGIVCFEAIRGQTILNTSLFAAPFFTFVGYRLVLVKDTPTEQAPQLSLRAPASVGTV